MADDDTCPLCGWDDHADGCPNLPGRKGLALVDTYGNKPPKT